MIRLPTTSTRLPTPPQDRTANMVPDMRQEFVTAPFTLLYDDREEAGGWRFRGLHANADRNYLPIMVPLKKVHLKTGDYSIEGQQHLVTVERKSLSDLYGTLAGGRERFEREHARMKSMIDAGGLACVIVEATRREALHAPIVQTSYPPKSVERTRVSWFAKYRVPWFFCDSRGEAEEECYRLLEQWWRHHGDR